ncbi:hypothetical protein [Labrenzia sp. R5_0]|uniref:hypothetical protein n=1 Tax=Labrenzia sp. R5_0 TaxID=2821108 RepID=UPI001ADD1F3E|nr:hypothetical protein [Labrenzia sp. R5_0]MBO9458996.1 hypothetical protein [Labrenzia sp. R5_0]
MSIFNVSEFSLMRAVHELVTKVEAIDNLEVRFSRSVAELKQCAIQSGKKNIVGEHFAQELNTLPPSQVLWIGVFDSEDNCIATCASKFEDFRGWSLQQQIIAYFERVFRTADNKPVQLEHSAAEYAGVVCGKTVYIGEGHVKPEYRSHNILGLIQRALILQAHFHWRPDLVYGFMRPDKIRKRYHLNWGYTLALPALLHWRTPPADASLHNLYFVAVGPEGIARLAADPLLAGWSRPSGNSKQGTPLPAPSSEAQ